MTDEWEVVSKVQSPGSVAQQIVMLGQADSFYDYTVKNSETGEERTVIAEDRYELGDKISRGEFEPEYESGRDARDTRDDDSSESKDSGSSSSYDDSSDSGSYSYDYSQVYAAKHAAVTPIDAVRPEKGDENRSEQSTILRILAVALAVLALFAIVGSMVDENGRLKPAAKKVLVSAAAAIAILIVSILILAILLVWTSAD